MSPSSTVPHLATAFTGPPSQLEQLFFKHHARIEAWFSEQFSKTPPPLYASVDLRNAGFKIAPVDTNLFPAGFNNLSDQLHPWCTQAVAATIADLCPHVTRILLIPESHSRNRFYFESIGVLHRLISAAGYQLRLGCLDAAGGGAPQAITLSDGTCLPIEPVVRDHDKIQLTDFVPEAIILNNDLSQGVPDVLQGLTQQMLPSADMGWSSRLKSQHFEVYNTVAEAFALLLDCDPWWFNPLFEQCPEVDFMQREGQQCLYSRAQQLMRKVKYKHQQYQHDTAPFLAVKADAGTYGMAVMMIDEPEILLRLNRKQRTAMSTSKGGKQVTQVILQEGILSTERLGEDAAVAEPVVYFIGSYVAGGFYRVHKGKKAQDNLNAPGMYFEPMPLMSTSGTDPIESNRFYAYAVVARLALLAAAREAQ